MLKTSPIVLTGDRPTGPLHLGHFIGSLSSRLTFQDTHRQYVMIADMQALTDHAKDPARVDANISAVMLDYLSVGLDPDKTTFLLQSAIPALSELTMYYLNLVTWNRLKHNPTVKQEILQKNFGDEIPAGFMVYPVSQAADITAFQAQIVPVGEDQRPMIEQTNELVRRFNRLYQTNVLQTVEAVVPKMGRLPGTDGNAKMGKSLGNAIFLSDAPDVIRKKVQKMHSDPDHVNIEDPGKVEGNPVFIYLDAFGEDRAYIASLKDQYTKGGLGDGKIKKYLCDVLLAFLEPIHKKRATFSKEQGHIDDILRKGSAVANEVANNTLMRVKNAMGMRHYPNIH